jgi:hypothetical protein
MKIEKQLKQRKKQGTNYELEGMEMEGVVKEN